MPPASLIRRRATHGPNAAHPDRPDPPPVPAPGWAVIAGDMLKARRFVSCGAGVGEVGMICWGPWSRRGIRRRIQAEQQAGCPTAGDRRRSVNDTVLAGYLGSFENSNVAAGQTLNRTRKVSLFAQCGLPMFRDYPFGGRSSVGRYQAHFDTIPVELPASVVADSFDAGIDADDIANCREGLHQLVHVRNQELAMSASRDVATGEKFANRVSKVGRTNQDAFTRKGRCRKGVEPSLHAAG